MATRILLLRTARHLDTALGALRNAYPAARISVCAGSASESVLDAAGVDRSDRVIGEWSHFSPSTLLRSPTGRKLLRGHRDVVAVMWMDRDGRGQDNVTRSALLLSPRGFIAILPDGSWRRHSGRRAMVRELARAVRSMAVAVAVLTLLLIPARVLRAAGH